MSWKQTRINYDKKQGCNGNKCTQELNTGSETLEQLDQNRNCYNYKHSCTFIALFIISPQGENYHFQLV